ncbi:DUF4254 domain-containing protein [Mucilaginibacter flavus]|nr:DUF4254 domain-containing protein [Mucilaginibacter flavus]
MINVQQVVRNQAEQISKWHVQLILSEEVLPMSLIQENNHWNYLLWHQEDVARTIDIEPSAMVLAKRNIDLFNQNRNDCIEKIDEWILEFLNVKKVNPKGRLHSETPGMMIDRLSIMALKIYHMREEAARGDASPLHRLNCEKKVALLNEQIKDLATCLAGVLDDLERGELSFKVYRQFKMYNDPDLNPQIYGKHGKENR